MSVIDLTPGEYAAKLRAFDCVQAPCAIDGYLYMVIRGSEDDNLYRVAV